jgi:hypothetical protein
VRVPVNGAEFAVLKSLIHYCLPRLLGMDVIMEGPPVIGRDQGQGQGGQGGVY